MELKSDHMLLSSAPNSSMQPAQLSMAPGMRVERCLAREQHGFQIVDSVGTCVATFRTISESEVGFWLADITNNVQLLQYA